MTKRKSLQEQKEQATAVHNSRYTYDEWTVGSPVHSKISITCPNHGVFQQRLNSHLQGRGCPECGKAAKINTPGLQETQQRAAAIHDNKYDYSLWKNTTTLHDKVTIICPIHGNFSTTVSSHIHSKTGCPECGRLRRTKGAEYFIDKAITIHNNKYDYSKIPPTASRMDTVTIVCPDHGEYQQVLINHSQGAGCRICAGREIDPETELWLAAKHNLIRAHISHKKSLPQLAGELGVSQSTVYCSMQKHAIDVQRFHSSTGEHEIVEFLQSLGVTNVITNTKKLIAPYEVDIFLPDYNLAIEYNGLYWHSELAGKTANYHLDKTERVESKGIRLVHIFEDEWRDMNRQCKDTLRHLIGKSENGVYARKTTIREISWTVAKQFLNEHHLLGAGACGDYRIGGYDATGALIGVMVFGRQNNERSDESAVELRRFVTNKKNNPGLGSKLFKYAVRHRKYSRVVAFVDRRWFTGNFLQLLR